MNGSRVNRRGAFVSCAGSTAGGEHFGFWPYVWEIKGPLSHHVYVGRTGDSSSPPASSPFKRIGQHLNPSPPRKGSTLGKQLRRAGDNCEECDFRKVAIGPIFPDQIDFESHRPFRAPDGGIGEGLADELRERRSEDMSSSVRIQPPECQMATLVG